jgi:hypothetical protein
MRELSSPADLSTIQSLGTSVGPGVCTDVSEKTEIRAPSRGFILYRNYFSIPVKDTWNINVASV